MTGERVERRLAAILAADVEGYSRLMGTDEVATLRDLTQRRSILDGLIAAHRGRIANTAGDSVLAEFGSAVDAVQCAVEAQAALAEANAPLTPDHHINFRIGVHVGDVMVKGGDLFGDGVNIAARLQTLASAGGTCISGATHDQVRKLLPFAFVDLGAQQVKNIEEPIRTFAVTTKGMSSVLASSNASVPLALPDKPSIAILPFQNMSGDPEQEYFADGMVEDITTALSRFKSLFVIARNSSFTYKGKAIDIKQVGRELGVRYVLEGSIRKAGGKVRITGQLIDAVSGTHLWADRFDGSSDDIFDLQDKVASSVVGAIAPNVTHAEIERAKRKSPNNLNAYDYFLKGQSSHWQYTKDGTDEAIGLYEQAVVLDRQFASAYAALATAYYQRAIQKWSASPASDMSRSMECASFAFSLKPEDPATLVRIAYVFSNAGGEVERADSICTEAIRLNPNGMDAYIYGGWAKVFLGQHQAALDYFHRAIRLSPADPRIFYARAGAAVSLFFIGDYEEGRKYALEALRDHPADLTALRTAVACSASMGDVQAAREFLRRLVALSPSERISDLRRRAPYRREEDYLKLEQSYRLVGMPE